MKTIFLYFNTLKYLHFIQIYWRIWLWIYKPIFKPGFVARIRPRSFSWIDTPRHPPKMFGEKDFFFLNERGKFDGNIDWNDSRFSKLWLYNLHYFDDLNCSNPNDRKSWHQGLISSWIKENQYARGCGWESYPTSLRIVNWIKWSMSGFVLSDDAKKSLSIQINWLAKRIERHLLGNHLFANLKALIYYGLYFEGDDADSKLKIGLKECIDQIKEQIKIDGGHFELSPMYHSIVLQDILDLINLMNCYPKKIPLESIVSLKSCASKMITWLELMCHPDGEISFFNDCAFNVALSFSDLKDYAAKLGVNQPIQINYSKLQIYRLESSGYLNIRSREATLILDTAEVGPAYLPGHAHADTLSFEVSIFEQRVIVNGGTSCYGSGLERIRERHTKSHSTVEVDGQSSSEIWGGFRVARRAKPFNFGMISTRNEISVGCSHDGYLRLKGKPIHRREWSMTKKQLTISDWVTGGEHRSIARFILHPSVYIERLNKSDWYICMPFGQKVLFQVLSGSGFVESATYATEFGKVLQTQCLALDLSSGYSQARLQWN